VALSKTDAGSSSTADTAVNGKFINFKVIIKKV
jgi:hypothetical protein